MNKLVAFSCLIVIFLVVGSDQKCQQQHRFHHDFKGGRKNCCGDAIEKLFPHDHIEDYCTKTVLGESKLEKLNQEELNSEMVCICQCVGQYRDYIDVDGNIKPKEYKLFVEEKLSSTKYMEPHVNQMISTCLKRLENTTTIENPSDRCKITGIVSDWCLVEQIVIHCPEDHMNDKPFCTKLQEKFMNATSPISNKIA